MTNLTGSVFAAVLLFSACDGNHGISLGHTDASPGSGSGDLASHDPDAGSGDSRAASTIVGDCASDDDCVLVLDYRAGFECWWPVGASLADVSRDHCLLPWTWKRGQPAWCGTAAPPGDCPGGDIPVMHSCITPVCATATCNEGKCTSVLAIGGDGQCATTAREAPVDCGTLRANYFSALAAAQECDPKTEPTTCSPGYLDSCGCPVAASSTGPQAAALSCAQAALTNGNCGYGNCASACPTANQRAVCVPNGTGSMGTCGLQ